MQRRPFGPLGDVSVIGQGTWKLRDPEAARKAIRAGIEAGMDHIDTAEAYDGSEESLAPILGARRDLLFVVSKVQPRNADKHGTRRACKASLERLGTDRLDAYLLHWPGPHPIEETMHAMAGLIDDGLIRGAGVSNFDVAQMEEAQDVLGGHPLTCNQVL